MNEKNSHRRIGKCKCGHSGDAPDSDHHDQKIADDVVATGHGKCKICDCPMFTWVGWMKT